MRDGSNLVETVNAELFKNGNYYQTSNAVTFNSVVNQAYTIFVKTHISLGRAFTGVSLTQTQTLDCTVGSDAACGDLISLRDTKILESGDSDGFDLNSGSYNKIDSADLQVLTLYFNQSAVDLATSADFNVDGFVDISDLEIIGKNYTLQGD